MRNLIEEQAEIHQILSNPSRLLILHSLVEKEMSVGEIAEQIGASLQNTSQHLRLMKDKGVLEARRDGQTIFYRIAVNETGESCKRLLTCLETHNQSIYQEA
jgi:ArsR family transcriptional regulator, virulence genes transcriptional regulator